MADLIAQGGQGDHRWRRPLPEGHPVTLGRTSEPWSVPWDEKVSRRHVEVAWREGQLDVRRLSEARNQIYYRGRAAESFSLRPGEHFVVGSTMFTLVDEPVRVTKDAPQPDDRRAFDSHDLRQRPFRDADQRITVLSRLVEIMSSATDETELVVRIVNLLLTGVPRAAAVAVVIQEGDGPTSRLTVRHWDRRGSTITDFRPSERLIREALQRRSSMLHVWQAGKSTPVVVSETAVGDYTTESDEDWAFCTPLPGDAGRGWALYVAGRCPSSAAIETGRDEWADALRDDVKFTELAATTISNLRQSQSLVRQQASLRQFFSPIVLTTLTGREPDEVLAPREAEVAVLFCDLRGFSRTSARAANDLLGLLQRVSDALGVMTRHILAEGGVIGDFHGDSAMGFWGWPLAQPDAAQRACRAALAIRAEFAEAAAVAGHPLADFRIGIGVATGPAVAGKIGSIDQVKVTVFGPVVNLASRLEAMTKILRAPILIDPRTAEIVRATLPPETARVRRVASVRPPGLDNAVDVSQLLPPESVDPLLTAEHLAAYETAVAAFHSGDWSQAFRLLHQVPAEDRVKDVLTVFIAQHNRTPPPNWDGVISITDKGGLP